MDDELKPCPFCGGKAHLMRYVSDYGNVYYEALCLECGNGTAYCKTEKSALKKWNTRKSEKE